MKTPRTAKSMGATKRIALLITPPPAAERRNPYPELLQKLLSEGAELLVVGSRRPVIEDHPNLQFRLINLPGWRTSGHLAGLYLSLVGPFLLLFAAIRFRPNKFVVFTPWGALIAALSSFCLRAPLTLLINIAPWKTAERRHRIAPLRGLFYLFDCLGLLCARAIGSSSAALANELATLIPLLEPRISVIDFAPDPALLNGSSALYREWEQRSANFPKRKQQFLRDNDLPEKSFIIATLDEFQVLKNLEYVFRAVGALDDERVLLLVYGDGPQRVSLSSLMLSLGLDEQVQLLGRSEQFFELLTVADLIIVPTGERGVLPLRELLTVGAPIVAADTLEAREVLKFPELIFERDNVQAIVEAITRVRSSKEARRMMGERTRERAAGYQLNWPEAVSRLVLPTNRT